MIASMYLFSYSKFNVLTALVCFQILALYRYHLPTLAPQLRLNTSLDRVQLDISSRYHFIDLKYFGTFKLLS